MVIKFAGTGLASSGIVRPETGHASGARGGGSAACRTRRGAAFARSVVVPKTEDASRARGGGSTAFRTRVNTRFTFSRVVPKSILAGHANIFL